MLSLHTDNSRARCASKADLVLCCGRRVRVQTIQPSIINSVPAFFNKIYNEYRESLAQALKQSPNPQLADSVKQRVLSAYSTCLGTRRCPAAGCACAVITHPRCRVGFRQQPEHACRG